MLPLLVLLVAASAVLCSPVDPRPTPSQASVRERFLNNIKNYGKLHFDLRRPRRSRTRPSDPQNDAAVDASQAGLLAAAPQPDLSAKTPLQTAQPSSLLELATTDASVEDLEDPCTVLAMDPTYDHAVACLDYFPFQKRYKGHTIDVIKSVLTQLHVFYDMFTNPPDPQFTPPYDIMKVIDAIDKKNDYVNDRDWHEALMDAFLPLNDAHSQFTSYCFSSLVFKQPFLPVARMDKTGHTRIYVGGISEMYESGLYKPHLNKEILEIDGRPALDVLTEYANTRIGLYKDPATRFNDLFAYKAFTSAGTWQVVPGKFASRLRVPKSKTVKYKLGPPEQPVEVEAEWAVVLPSTTFQNAYEYLHNFCYSTSAKKAQAVADQAQERLKIAGQRKRIDFLNNPTLNAHARPEVDAVMADNGRIADPLSAAQGMALYATSNSEAGVLVVPTFKFSGPIATSNWRNNMVCLLEEFRAKKFSKLILDLTGNGGGNICLAMELMYALINKQRTETFPDSPNRLLKDQRVTKVLKWLTEKTVETPGSEEITFNPKSKISPITNKPFEGKVEQLLQPERQHPALTKLYASLNGNKPSMYSPLFDHMCISPDSPMNDVNLGLDPANIVIVSSGNCGSICALLTHSLREFGGATTYAVGSRADQQRSVAAFPGGQVLNVGDLRNIYEALDVDPVEVLDDDRNPFLPDWFMISAFLSFPLREAYGHKDPNAPLEYKYIPADDMIHIGEDAWFRPDVVWERALQLKQWVS